MCVNRIAWLVVCPYSLAFRYTVWYSDSRNRGYLSPLVRGDAEGATAEIEARIAKRREMRATQPSTEYPIFKLEDMLKVPKHAQAPR